MPPSPDPISVILRSVRVVGNEFCWPATEALEIDEAFGRLDRLILGAELWSFEDGPNPTVLGWTHFSVPRGTWRHRVAVCGRLAADQLLGHAGDLTAWSISRG